jgi:hypothetical protein
LKRSGVKRVTLGLRATRGGCIVVAVTHEPRGAPQVVLSTFLPTAAVDDRIAREPYHVAAETVRSRSAGALARAEATVREGRARQDALAADGLRSIVEQLQDASWNPSGAVLLVNRAGWVTDLLQYSFASESHPPVAEGLAIRDALRFALRENGIDFVEVDEKTLLADRRLADCTSNFDGPWRKEHKLACLAAWTNSPRD